MSESGDPLFKPIETPAKIAVTPIDSVVVTKYFNNNDNPSLLNLIVDDVIHVLSKPSPNWWDGIIVDPIGQATRGWFSPMYTKPLVEGPMSQSSSGGTTSSFNSTELINNDNTLEGPTSITATTPTITTNNNNNNINNNNHNKAPNHQSSITTNMSLASSYNMGHQPSMASTTTTNNNMTTNNKSTPTIKITSTEEIEAYFDPNISGGHAFNFVPIWIPHITEDNQFVYYNPKLNIYSKNLPMTSHPIPDDGSLIEFPSGTEFNGIEGVPYKKNADQTSLVSEEDSSNSLHKNSVTNSEGQVHFQSNVNKSNIRPSLVSTEQTSSNLDEEKYKRFINRMLYNPDLFYYDPSDLTNWDQLLRTLQFVVKMCIDAVSKYSKQLFLAHLNTISKLVVLYQLATRLMIGELTENHVAPLVSKLLKKITSALIQLTINGNLHLMGDKDAPHFLGSLESEGHDNDTDHEDAEDNDDDDDGDDDGSDTEKGEIEGTQYGENVEIPMPRAPLNRSSTDTIVESSKSKAKYQGHTLNLEETSEDFMANAKSGSIASNSTILPRGRFRTNLPNTIRSSTPASSIRSGASSGNAEIYLHQAERDAFKLLRRAEMIHNIFSNLKLSNNGNSKSLPLVFPRFFKNIYDGGNWSNPWSFGPEINHIDIDYDLIFNPSKLKNKNKNKVVLDDEIINLMQKRKVEAVNVLNNVLNVINTPVGKEVDIEKFVEQRNVNVLALIYHCVPIINKFLDALTSIDFTVFSMILKLNKGSSQPETPSENVGGQNSVSGPNTPNSSLENVAPPMSSSTELVDDSNSTTNTNTDSQTSWKYTKKGTLVDDYVNAKEASDVHDEDFISNTQSNSHFYEATSKMVTTGINEFLEAKQELHSILGELIVDAQNLTVEDPEVFTGLKEDDVLVYDKSIAEMPTEKYATKLFEKMTIEDNAFLTEGLCLYDTHLKMKRTIQQVFERFDVVLYAISQLKDQRQSILNYCSRLMDTDFTVASLFMAERHNTMISSLSANEFSYDGHRRTSSMSSEESIAWFLDIDDEEKSLIYDANGIKGGSLKGLIAKLVNANDTDTDFINTMLLCFKTFTTPVQFFQMLFDKYDTSMPEALTYEEYGLWLEKKLRPMQERILEIIELLFIRYWNVNYSSPELIKIWTDFAKRNRNQVPNDLVDAGLGLMAMTSQSQVYEMYGDGNPEVEPPMEKTPVPLTVGKTLKKGKLTLKDVDSLELARQISLDQYKLFSKINQFELLSRSWNVRKYGSIGTSTGITQFIAHCNKLTHFTSYMILKRTDLRQRAEQIKYFILLAEKFLKLKNFSSMTAIISGLASTQVSRLKKTWELVPKHILLAFDKMDSLMSIGKNYSEYRNILRYVISDNVPCLPFLGVYLSDLRFMADGNSDYLHGKKNLINISKRSAISSSITEVLNFGTIPYNFERIPEIQEYLQEHFDACPDEDTMYEMSLKLEPRVSASTTVAQQKKGKDKNKANQVNYRVFNPQYVL